VLFIWRHISCRLLKLPNILRVVCRTVDTHRFYLHDMKKHSVVYNSQHLGPWPYEIRTLRNKAPWRDTSEANLVCRTFYWQHFLPMPKYLARQILVTYEVCHNYWCPRLVYNHSIAIPVLKKLVCWGANLISDDTPGYELSTTQELPTEFSYFLIMP
jgi:hypothetical protein